MASKNVQNNQQLLVHAIDTVVQNRLQDYSTTNSTIGVVVRDPNNYHCIVDIKGEQIECSVPEHLHSWIQEDDVVIVQDLYNDGRSRVIVGKTGQLQSNPSVVIYDEETGRDISGVDGVFNDKGEKIAYTHVYAKGGF